MASVIVMAQPMTAVAGGTASCSVAASGSAPLRYQWQENGQAIPGATNATLLLPYVPPLGEASYRDFLVFTENVTRLQGGVFLNYGTAVMGPEVYLKALAMARNVAHQEERKINEFTTAVFDLVDLGDDLGHEAPKSDARYYYRPFKTILVRTVQDGGESYYIRGPHRGTLPALHRLLTEA